MGTYILIEGIYDTLDLFSEEIRLSLSERGHRCIVLHRDSMERDLKQLLGAHIDAVITFNNLAYNLGEDAGGNLWEALGTRYINILMDHPFHYHRQLGDMPECTELYCIDRNHTEYVKRYYPNIKHCGFLPHAGCAYATSALAERSSIPAKRDIPVLYAGNLSRVLIEQLIPDFDQFPEIDGAEFSKEVLSRLISEPMLTTEQAIRDRLHELHIPLDSPDDELRYINGFRFIDGFAVSYYRELAVRIPAERGIPVHILGLGWETCEWTCNPNITLLGKVNAADVLPYMRRARVVLNTLTWFKVGAHDRIYNGMLSGAAVVSDRSEYLDELSLPIETFDLENIYSLPDIVGSLLSDEPRRAALSVKAYDEVVRHHTWADRLEELL